MNAAQHLAIAEQLLEPQALDATTGLLVFDQARTTAALAHAVIAVADQLGVAHAPVKGGNDNAPAGGS